MLPWIFAILVLFNLGLFFWGYQREKSMEPPSIPVPEGSYEIRLLDEPKQPEQQNRSTGQPEQSENAGAPEGTSSPDVTDEIGEKEEPRSPIATSSDEIGAASNDAQPEPESEEPADTEVVEAEAENPGRSGQPTSASQQEDQRPNDPDKPETDAADEQAEESANPRPEPAPSDDDGAATNELF